MKILAGFLLVCNLGLLFLIYSGQGKHWMPSFGRTELTLIQGAEAQESTPYTLYVFFHGDGNCACLEDWPNWMDLANSYTGLLQLKGVFNGESETKFVDFSTGVNLPFPLYRDSGNTLRNQFGVFPGEVVKVLIGPSGQVLLLDSDQVKAKDQVYFVQRVKDHLEAH